MHKEELKELILSDDFQIEIYHILDKNMIQTWDWVDGEEVPRDEFYIDQAKEEITQMLINKLVGEQE